MEAMPQIFSFWRVVTKLTETDGAQGDTQIRREDARRLRPDPFCVQRPAFTIRVAAC